MLDSVEIAKQVRANLFEKPQYSAPTIHDIVLEVLRMLADSGYLGIERIEKKKPKTKKHKSGA